MKHFFLLFFLSTILSFTNSSAQTKDSTVTEIDTIIKPYTADELDVDDKLNNIFSEQMDSLLKSWAVQNRFDFSELRTNVYPKNLPDSVYIKRLAEIEEVIDLSYNKIVGKYIKAYTERGRTQLEVMLGLSAYYFPIFEEVLDKYDMPLEIKHLAIIESALNPTAKSRAGANGLWQFMYGTAKSLNLEISSFVDERRDPLKSTDAAAKYLSKLYSLYGNWHLAIAAYNCGPGNVNKAIRRSGGKQNYWKIYYHLPRETRGYVPAFIAATYAFKYHKEHKLVPRYPKIPLTVDTIMITNYLHFNQVSEKINIDKEKLRILNPMFRRDIIPAKENKAYPLVLPQEKIMSFLDQETSIFAYKRDDFFPNNTLVKPTNSSSKDFYPAEIKGKAKILYTIKEGDNVGFIASWFNVRSADLRYWNNIRRNMIRVGKKLTIYVSEKDKAKYKKINAMSFAQKQASIGKSANSNKEEAEPIDPNYLYYKVRQGDNLWDIAKKYSGISAKQIKQLNKLKNNSLHIGQQLKIKPRG